MTDQDLHKQEKMKVPFTIKDSTRTDVVSIAWPVLVELLLGSLFLMVDMIMIGRIRDSAVAAASVAAVGMTNQPLLIGLSLVQALNVGGTAMVARYLGAKKEHRIENTFKHVLLLSLCMLALPLAIFGFVFSNRILEFLGAQPDAIQVGGSYFRVTMISFLFQSINLSISAALRGIGETKIPMRINIRVNFLNVIGNALLIYGLLGFPELGVTGAAISTAFSNMIASMLLFRYVLSGKSVVQINLKNPFKFNRDTIFNLIRIGVPASLEQMILRVGILMFARIVAGLGTVVFAAHQIALNILGLSFHPAQAFSISASSLVGRSIGSKELSRAEAYAKETRKLGSYFSTGMGIIFFFFGSTIAGLFTRNQEVVNNVATVLKIIALVQPFQSSQLILSGGLRGAGDTIYPMLSTLIGVLIIRVSLAYVFVNLLGYGLVGAWLAVLIDQFIRWILVFLRFRTGKWKYVKIR